MPRHTHAPIMVRMPSIKSNKHENDIITFKWILLYLLSIGTIRKHKQSLLAFKWMKRFCILVDNLLLYYKSESDKKPLGIIQLNTGYQLVIPAKSNGFLFNLENPNKNYSNYSVCFLFSFIYLHIFRTSFFSLCITAHQLS